MFCRENIMMPKKIITILTIILITPMLLQARGGGRGESKSTAKDTKSKKTVRSHGRSQRNRGSTWEPSHQFDDKTWTFKQGQWGFDTEGTRWVWDNNLRRVISREPSTADDTAEVIYLLHNITEPPIAAWEAQRRAAWGLSNFGFNASNDWNQAATAPNHIDPRLEEHESDNEDEEEDLYATD